MEIGNRVLKTGKSLMAAARILMIAFLVPIISMIYILLVDTSRFFDYLLLAGYYSKLNLFMLISYGFLGLGIFGGFLYIVSMFMLAAGQLVINTSPKEQLKSISTRKLGELVASTECRQYLLYASTLESDEEAKKYLQQLKDSLTDKDDCLLADKLSALSDTRIGIRIYLDKK